MRSRVLRRWESSGDFPRLTKEQRFTQGYDAAADVRRRLDHAYDLGYGNVTETKEYGQSDVMCG